jgi:hypothetical protein
VRALEAENEKLKLEIEYKRLLSGDEERKAMINFMTVVANKLN